MFYFACFPSSIVYIASSINATKIWQQWRRQQQKMFSDCKFEFFSLNYSCFIKLYLIVSVFFVSVFTINIRISIKPVPHRRVRRPSKLWFRCTAPPQRVTNLKAPKSVDHMCYDEATTTNEEAPNLVASYFFAGAAATNITIQVFDADDDLFFEHHDGRPQDLTIVIQKVKATTRVEPWLSTL